MTAQVTEERLRQFGAIVARLIRKEDISRAEAKECRRQICAEEQPELQQGAFMAVLKSKPETLDEIARTFDGLSEYDTAKVEIDTPGRQDRAYREGERAAVAACSRGNDVNCYALTAWWI